MPPLHFTNDMPVCLLQAALPTQGGYFSLVKIVLFFLVLVLWAHNAAWVQQDVKRVKVPAGLYVVLVFGGGLLGLFIWVLVPWFWAGVAIFALVYGPAIGAYVVFRNQRVAPSRTVLTRAHWQRLTSGGGKAKGAEEVHAKDRTRIKDSQGNAPPWPKDPAENAGYQGLQDLLFDAIWRRATDVRLDFVPQQPVAVTYRVDGVERTREPVEANLGPYILGHIKRIAGMDPAEHRRPQAGRFGAAIGAAGQSERTAEVQAKASGSTAGQRVVLRLISEESRFRLPDLGFTKPQSAMVEKLAAAPKGLIICVGPRASGVTSTLYAFLRSHDAFMQNIHTLETAKAMDLENVTQHLYDSKDGAISFGKRFRSIIRTEPDVSMAGAAPDSETLLYAAEAGRFGKKVYLGMAAGDALGGLGRFIQATGDNALAASSLLAVTSQRLVRILCTQCRRGYKPDPALLKKANLPVGENRPFYRPPNPTELEMDRQGNPIICQACQGAGYFGRTGIFEVLVLDEELRAQVAKGSPLATIKAEARKKGFQYLQEVAIHKVYDGVTSINEVLRVTKEKAAKMEEG